MSQTERTQLANQINEAIEQVGRHQVWLKGAASAAPGGRKSCYRLVLEAGALNPVLAALKDQSAREGLRTDLRDLPAQGQNREPEVRVLAGEQLVGCWRLRVIPRLRYAAIIIDDLGQDREAIHRILQIPYPLTWAVLPQLPYSVAAAEEAHRAGREVMLHLPMEPEESYPNSAGKGVLKVGMTREQRWRVLQTDLNAVPYIVGVNNHMGSKATADPDTMFQVMQALAGRNLYFVDSRTTPQSVALEAARRVGVPALHRSVFLDNTPSLEAIRERLAEFRRLIDEHGSSLAIGHPHATTLAALSGFVPTLEREDIRLVPVSKLLALPQAGKGNGRAFSAARQ